MTDQPNDTAILDAILEPVDERGYGLLVATAQQAVLPRKLDEGVYAILDAEGGIQIRETEGYAQRRAFDWDRSHADRPQFIHRNPTLLNVDSLIDYLRRNTASTAATEVDDAEFAHAAGELELWADIDNRTIHGILDGHDGLWKHTATLMLKVSREWAEWTQVDGKMYAQAEFAQFVEDHISTIASPDGGMLVDICETLTGKTDVAWKSQSLGANGQRQFVYEEKIEGQAGPKGNLVIPTELTLVLRPFQGSEAIAVTARFRYRLRDGLLSIGVKLAEPERVLEEAFNAIVEEVQDRVPVHVNHGRP